MAPIHLSSYGTLVTTVVYILIGIGFGASLEQAGFGNSRNIAGQFYLKNQRVVKVMFTAIVVALLLLFWSVAMGFLDYNRIGIEETHLGPVILGGLLLGMGMVLGGYCPGTSIVATFTLAWDGLLFVIGVMLGLFLFGETSSYYENFWNNSGYYGRFTLQDWLGVDAGYVVVAVIIMAILMFAGAEFFERILNDPQKGERKPRKVSRGKAFGAILLLVAAVGLAYRGQPTPERLMKWHQKEIDQKIANREVQIDPGELLELMEDKLVTVVCIDVRDPADYNLFHLINSYNLSLDQLDSKVIKDLPTTAVKVVMSNGEERAEKAYRILASMEVPNVYILEGGINNWLHAYGEGEKSLVLKPIKDPRSDERCYDFAIALGDRNEAADPDPHHVPERKFTKKVVIAKPKAVAAGCGG